MAAGNAAGPRRRPIWLAALAAMVTFVAAVGLWNRQNAQVVSDRVEDPGGLLQAATAEGTSLASVGPVSGLALACTAWLLDTEGGPDGAAHAVTTGTCAGATDPGSVVSDEPVSARTVAFHFFAPLTSAALPEVVEVPVERIEWASVRGTDLAVLRLAATMGELAAAGIEPIQPVGSPAPGTEILIAGVPVAGIPDNERYLRGSRCQAGATTDVLAGDLLWHDLQASDCAGILAGSQGSVVLNEAGQAVGMVNTSTIGVAEGADCTVRRPCEVSGSAPTVAPNTSYAVAVDVLAGCFTSGDFEVGGSCGLEDPATVAVARVPATSVAPGASVQVQVQGSAADLTRTGFKVGQLAALDCRSATAWQAIRTSGRSVRMPTHEGFALVCVGSPAQPTEIVVRVDGTPPDPATIELRQLPVQGGIEVQPVPAAPELTAFRWVSGPQGAIDCAAAEGYVLYTGSRALIQAADLPSTVCVIGIDAAGNESRPSEHQVPT